MTSQEGGGGVQEGGGYRIPCLARGWHVVVPQVVCVVVSIGGLEVRAAGGQSTGDVEDEKQVVQFADELVRPVNTCNKQTHTKHTKYTRSLGYRKRVSFTMSHPKAKREDKVKRS